MIRLDKYLSDYTEMTRSQAKKAIRSGKIRVNGELVRSGDDKVSFSDSVYWDGVEVKGMKHQYIMLNKPAGIISATKDCRDETVVEYIADHPDRQKNRGKMDPQMMLAKDLFPAGRLDKDTEGLLLLTNDGQMAHELLSPRKHVEKKYYVQLERDVDSTYVEKMAQGLEIGEKKPTKPAVLEVLRSREVYITITEGKFHQIKRMFETLGNRVTYLKRLEMGALVLDPDLQVGEWRYLTEEEIRLLAERKGG